MKETCDDSGWIAGEVLMNTRLKNMILGPFNLLYRVNPALCTRILFQLKCGSKLDLEQPKTYLEKLNWLKLRDRNPLMPVCADKFRARGYIEEQGLGAYLPRLLWYGEDPDAIPFERLPERFIIKISNGCGYNIICRNRADFDCGAARKKLRRWMREKYLPCYGEWMYARSSPVIIVEEFLSDGEHMVPKDYKFMCFNGVEGGVGCIMVDSGRYIRHTRRVYDRNWNPMEEVRISIAEQTEELEPRPACLEEMCAAAAKLSAPFVHARVDFFVIGGRFYIGEITFFNCAGFGFIRPERFNLQMGAWMRLPE